MKLNLGRFLGKSASPATPSAMVSSGVPQPSDFDSLVTRWDAYQSRYFDEICQLAGAWFHNADGDPLQTPRHVSIIHYGCSSGALFRALHERLGHLFELEFHGIDPDPLALAFLKAKIPTAKVYVADLEAFADRQETAPVKADLAIAAYQGYSLNESDMRKLFAGLRKAAPRLIVADQVDNADGNATRSMHLRDVSGRDYDANCHPFGALLRGAGFDGSRTFATEAPAKSITGYVAAFADGLDGALDGNSRLASSGKLVGLVPSADPASMRGDLVGPTLGQHLAADKLSCMDVGAAGGLHPLWQPFADFIEVDAFEPDIRACAAAQAASPAYIHWHPVALDRTTGTRQFHLLNAPTGSSFYPPNDDVQKYLNTSKYRGIDRIFDVETWGMADFIKRTNRPVPNLIKLDTQGSELDILSSLEDGQWGDVLAIETEVEFIEVYKGQPLFSDLDGFLKSKGMLLFDLRTAREYCAANDVDHYYMREHLNFGVGRNDMSARLYAGDALYFRDFLSQPPASKSFVMKMVATLLIYSYFDYALLLCDAGRESGVISEGEHKALFSEIVAAAPKPKLWQRADPEGLAARSARSADEWRDHIYQAFWQVRSWPNQ